MLVNLGGQILLGGILREPRREILSRGIHRRQIWLIIYSIVLLTGMLKVYNRDAVPVFFMANARKVILIDPGHGGWDPGKIDNAGRLEKDINLKIATKLQRDLELGGGVVFTTRLSDVALADKKRADLNNRKDLAAVTGADILISVHQNSYPSPNARGAQVFYYGDSERSKRLAECIQKRMSETQDISGRAAKPNESYYMLKRTTIPAVIVECGFMSNASDSAKLAKDEYQEKVAWSIYLGIIDYYTGT
ncbi:MAG: N-acetylmuramoyl-L-alanine amidase [Clostridiales bacterium]|jgi:N-acetylmuramoyl-L-alanine amidase|nr:N-acetylmuramoyl-L-alanine amidase [Clostridiales bacterium]